MSLYFNELDPYPAQWLRNLWPATTVDERSITDVQPADLADFRRCHFFGGIGGWEYALQIAGWPEDAEVWTGSVPCQPFSVAGKQRGAADERHLWPEFRRLIAECRPSVLFGEQVSGKLGRQWLAGVRTDLEKLGYAVGAADLPAASVGAPHIRQRLWWVADADQERWAWKLRQESRRSTDSAGGRSKGNLADSVSARLARRPQQPAWQEFQTAERSRDAEPWGGTELIHCRDGKYRPVKRGLCPLAIRVPSRVSKLRAFGNSIVPQLAAVFVKSFMESME